MKKLASFLGTTTRFVLFAMTAVVLTGCSEQGQAEAEQVQELPTIAIVGSADFVGDNTALELDAIPDELADRIIERLSQSKRFRVVERSATRRLIVEQRFSPDQRVTDLDRVIDSAVKNLNVVYPGTLSVAARIAKENEELKDFKSLGTLLGADYVVYAKLEQIEHSSNSVSIPGSDKVITKQSENALVQLRAINTGEGVLLGAASVKTSLGEMSIDGISISTQDKNLYDQLAQDCANSIIDMVSPATIVKASPLVINRGASDGISAGDQYLVKRAGESVTDVSGANLGPLLSDVGRVTVAQVQDSISIVEPVSGQPIEGDLVFLASAGASAAAPARSGAAIGQSQSASGKATIAIGKFVLDAGALSNSDVGRLRDDLLVKLTDTKRFQLMERTQVDQLLDEKLFTQIAQGGDMAGALAQLQGADYLVYGRISRFSIETEQESIPVVNEVRTITTGNVSFHLRIVDVHTGKVLAADKVEISDPMPEASKSDLMNVTSSAMVEGIVARLYPIKVLAAQGDVVYFNRGQDGGVQSGDIYQVLRMGEEMFDPDTGISFGFMESEVAEIEVTEVERARSKAAVISSAGDIEPGDLLKKVAVKAAPDPRANERQVRKPSF